MQRFLGVILIGAGMIGSPALAVEVPRGIVDPEVAIKDPTYSDPVFFWRYTSRPANTREPEAYFYWPDAVIKGSNGPFLPAATGRQRAISGQTLEDMADWAEARKSNALIVVHQGRVEFEKYWNGATAGDLVNGRALTRSVTPMLLGFAVADGKVGLDDPIGRYISEWAADKRGDVTVRQLAQNVSGLEVTPETPITQIHGNKDLCLVYCGDVVRAALSYDYALPPGTRFEFAQENMQLLALVIERAMGMPIQDLLSERVWTKIGAADAAFQSDRPNGTARVMCCMRATPRDWIRLGVLIAQDGQWQGRQVLPAEWVGTMATPSARYSSFGIGLWLGNPFIPLRTYFEDKPGIIPQSEPYLADDVRIMEGGGFRTIWMVPSRDLIIFRHGPGVPNWDNAYLVNAAIRGMKRK
ncbi:MAG: serine hydrolase [Rhodospirillaceae bacterium]|nr:serine hydrolase [Rhodospirillaceae bacterium]